MGGFSLRICGLVSCNGASMVLVLGRVAASPKFSRSEQVGGAPDMCPCSSAFSGSPATAPLWWDLQATPVFTAGAHTLVAVFAVRWNLWPRPPVSAGPTRLRKLRSALKSGMPSDSSPCLCIPCVCELQTYFGQATDWKSCYAGGCMHFCYQWLAGWPWIVPFPAYISYANINYQWSKQHCLSCAESVQAACHWQIREPLSLSLGSDGIGNHPLSSVSCRRAINISILYLLSLPPVSCRRAINWIS